MYGSSYSGIERTAFNTLDMSCVTLLNSLDISNTYIDILKPTSSSLLLLSYCPIKKSLFYILGKYFPA